MSAGEAQVEAPVRLRGACREAVQRVVVAAVSALFTARPRPGPLQCVHMRDLVLRASSPAQASPYIDWCLKVVHASGGSEQEEYRTLPRHSTDIVYMPSPDKLLYITNPPHM